MNLRTDCPGCVRDSNVALDHMEGCNYRAWPGLYDTIEAQKLEIEQLRSQLAGTESTLGKNRHDVIKLMLEGAEFFTDENVVELCKHAQLAADTLYPLPKAPDAT